MLPCGATEVSKDTDQAFAGETQENGSIIILASMVTVTQETREKRAFIFTSLNNGVLELWLGLYVD